MDEIMTTDLSDAVDPTNESDACALQEAVPNDAALIISEHEHGDDSLGRVEVHRRKDGTFLAIAHPCTDLTSFAADDLDDDDAAVWANDQMEGFDEFLVQEYKLATPQEPSTSLEIYPEALEHTATAAMGADAMTDGVLGALHAANPGLSRYSEELANGTATQLWTTFLASDHSD